MSTQDPDQQAVATLRDAIRDRLDKSGDDVQTISLPGLPPMGRVAGVWYAVMPDVDLVAVRPDAADPQWARLDAEGHIGAWQPMPRLPSSAPWN